MAIEAQLFVSIVAAVFSVILTGIVSVSGWYFHKYVLGQIEKNSEFRRYVGGEEGIESDGGEIDSIKELSAEMREQHSNLSVRMDHLTLYVQNIGEALRREGIVINDPDPDEDPAPGPMDSIRHLRWGDDD